MVHIYFSISNVTVDVFEKMMYRKRVVYLCDADERDKLCKNDWSWSLMVEM